MNVCMYVCQCIGMYVSVCVCGHVLLMNDQMTPEEIIICEIVYGKWDPAETKYTYSWRIVKGPPYSLIDKYRLIR